MNQVQHPSLTFCRRQAFDESLDGLVHGNDASAEQIGVALLNNVTKKEDIFYFVSHPNMTGEEHPCLTTANSFDHGKPCIFPFNSSKGIQYSCMEVYSHLRSHIMDLRTGDTVLRNALTKASYPMNLVT